MTIKVIPRFVFVSIFIAAWFTVVKAQDSTSIRIECGRTVIKVELHDTATTPLPRDFDKIASDIKSYKLFRIPDDPEAPTDPKNDLTSKIVPKSADDPECKNKSPYFLASPATIRITVSEPLEFGAVYVLKIRDLEMNGIKIDSNKFAMLKIDLLTKPAASMAVIAQAQNQRDRVSLVVSGSTNIPKQQNPPSSTIPPWGFTLMTRSFKISKNRAGVADLVDDSKQLGFVVDPTRSEPNRYEIVLDRNLNGQSYELFTQGLTDGAIVEPKDLPAKGILKFPGLPAPLTDPAISASISSVSAVHQKSVTEFGAKVTRPELVNLSNLLGFLPSGLSMGPTIAVDLGLNSTKSANSITADWLVSYKNDSHDNPCPRRNNTIGRTSIPCYAAWSQYHWYSLDYVRPYFGPRFESDRGFHRINVLGEAKLEFDFRRFDKNGTLGGRASILKRDFMLTNGKLSKDDLDFVKIKKGFKFIPYISVDAGKHVNNETVTNSKNKATEIVPEHPITRFYFGSSTAFEYQTSWFPITLSVDSFIVYLATPETIGFTTDQGVGLRRIRGIHPHSKTTLSFPFDPGGHLRLELIYENGRTAPNFEYLNKASASFKVAF